MGKGGAERDRLKCQGAPRAKVVLCTSPVMEWMVPSRLSLSHQVFSGGWVGSQGLGSWNFQVELKWLPASVPLSQEKSQGLLILPTGLTLCPKPPARTPHLCLEDSPDPRLVPLLVMP